MPAVEIPFGIRYSLEFFERVGKKYGRPIEWRFEPHVAEEVFRELAKEAGVAVYYRVAANLAIKADVAVQGIDRTALRTLLKIQRAVLESPPAPQRARY